MAQSEIEQGLQIYRPTYCNVYVCLYPATIGILISECFNVSLWREKNLKIYQTKNSLHQQYIYIVLLIFNFDKDTKFTYKIMGTGAFSQKVKILIGIFCQIKNLYRKSYAILFLKKIRISKALFCLLCPKLSC